MSATATMDKTKSAAKDDRRCRHERGPQSTLRTSYTIPLESPIGCLWICTCSVCGKYTEPCLTERESAARACAGWWFEGCRE